MSEYDKKLVDIISEEEALALPFKNGYSIYNTIFNQIDVIRFGCIIENMLTKGTSTNKVMENQGDNAFIVPLSILGNHTKNELAAKFLPDVLKEGMQTFNASLEKLKSGDIEPLAKALDHNITFCNKVLKGMSPEEIKNSPENFYCVAEVLRESVDAFKKYPELKEKSKVSEQDFKMASGWSTISEFQKIKKNVLRVFGFDSSSNIALGVTEYPRTEEAENAYVYNKAGNLMLDYVIKSKEKLFPKTKIAKIL